VTIDDSTELESQIAEWRGYMLRRRAVREADVAELEDHLRTTVAELMEAGLRADEAFLVAVKRMGNLDELSREFARVHSERLWKQLVLGASPAPSGSRRDLWVLVACAAAAAVAVKLPAAFGVGEQFYQRNFSFFALVPLTAYFVVRRRASAVTIGILAGLFALGAIAANAYPLRQSSQSLDLTSLHLPLALWLVVGFAYIGGDWRSDRKRMDFIRFTGEWFIYYVLIALAGGVLTGVTIGAFGTIDINAETFAEEWLIPCGAAASVVVAAWLVEAKQSVVENMAPVLTRLFTPLFAVALLVLLVAVLLSGNVIDVERDVLLLFNLLLVIVLGLLLYAISARDPIGKPGYFDWLQLGLAISAALVDLLVLLAVTGRITEWGATPNKAAALGANLVLMANLVWTAVLLTDFIRSKRSFEVLERWQTRYTAVYAIWLWTVVLVFPPLFSWR
jgi:hypothetical protein